MQNAQNMTEPQDAPSSDHEASTLASQVREMAITPKNLIGQDVGSSAPAYSHENTNISIAVDPVALITTECITVTSAMRKHARWAHSSVSAILGGGGSTSDRGSARLPAQSSRGLAHQRQPSQRSKRSPSTFDEDEGLAGRWGLRGKKGKSMQDNPLMSAFARLRSDLRGCPGIFDHLPALSGKQLTWNRYQGLRHPLPATSLPPSHSVFIDFSSYNFASNRSNHKTLRLQADR